MQLKERRKDLVASMMKEGIYEAAVAVLTQHGVAGLTMDRVAEQAGVAKGSLYNYFRNKRELVRFVHDKALEPLDQAADAVFERDLPATEKLESILRTCFEHFAAHRGIFDFLFNDPVSREVLDASKRSRHGDAIAKFTRIFAQGVEEGAFRPFDPAFLASAFFGAVLTTVEQQMLPGQGRPVDESVGMLMEVLLHGLKTDQ